MSREPGPVTSIPQIVGSLLARHRKLKGFNQQQVAAKIGVSQPYWSKLETGSAAPSVGQLFAASRAVDVSPSELVSETEAAIKELDQQGVAIQQEPVGTLPQNAKLVGAAVLGAVLASVILRR